MTDGNNMESSNTNSQDQQPGSAMNGLPDPADDHSTGDPNAASPPVANTGHPLPIPNETGDQEEDETPPPPPSLTDKLNQSLLSSFLDRLNNPNMASSFPEVQRIDTSEDRDPETALDVPEDH